MQPQHKSDAHPFTAILKARAERFLRDLGQLTKLGIRATDQLAPYVLFDGKRPAQQLPLF